MTPPNKPWTQGQNEGAPRTKPNYSKLDLIKYDTPHLGPRIQLMLSQLEFKLSVEKQYKEGIEKMSKLYQIDGDRRSKADAEAKRIESNQKIQLLKQALKRYEDLHVDMDSDEPDDDSIIAPNIRRPLTGRLHIRVLAVKDVDHASTSRFARGPETFVVIKVEDLVRARTKSTRNDKWLEESHDIDVDKANEIEITVYDKPGDHPLPIGMLWIRISDIAEEMRRKKIEQEFSASGWVSADHVENQPGTQYAYSPAGIGAPPGAGGGMYGNTTVAQGGVAGPDPNSAPVVDAWFALEPVGQIRLGLSFVKFNQNKRPLDLGLGRKGAVRQRKEEVHEMYGHKFIQQQFYNIMRCAFCGDFLKYAAGYQCSDCKYTCHKKCYDKVVTKCISKSNHDMDPDEEKLNHRIPHRFEPMTNIGANWCCHCGYMLPIGKKGSKKCTECHLTCHAQCTHLVPDFCGMPMDVANKVLTQIRNAKKQQRIPNAQSGQWQKPAAPMTPRKDSYLPPQQGPSAPMGSPPEQPSLYIPHQNYQTQAYPASPSSVDAAQAAYMSSQQVPQSPRHSQPPQGYPPQQPQYAAAAAALNAKRPDASYQQASYGYDQRPLSQVGGYGALPPPPQPQQPVDLYVQQALVQQPQMQQKQSFYGEIAQPRQQYPQTPVKAVPPVPQGPSGTGKPPSPQHAPPQKKIGLDHFNFLAVLGKGNFGKVMLAETKSTKQLYAIKVLKKEFIIENDEVESTRSEKRVFLIANKERHPFLLNLHACFQTETRVYFVMEYISGGDLMLHIQREQFGSKRAQFYAAEVCLALKYFHENGVIYRDLKLDNILLTLDGHIKIADYGLCKEDMWYGSTTGTFCGTPEFMAPEILMDKRYGRAVDWWAFGVLIYQMLLQQSPFRGEDEDEIYDAILADEPLYPIHMPRDSVSILQKLLQREPEKRLGSGPTDAQEVMNQAFFKTINWDDIYHKRVEPPFKPSISNPKDTSNFDQEFTSVTPVLTPVQSVLTQAMQEQFRGFSGIRGDRLEI
ncbi:kinase-like domain-containing protein [Kalaharituber pfeilii]|nr:kinase-like domain-containing protein [Kalaharituber pfeilii]